MTRTRLIAQIVSGLSLLSLACPDSTGPSFKDPRTYEWTIDTLKAPEPSYYTQLRRLCGAHSRDVYAVGWNDYYGRGAIWHYDGSKWSPVQWWRPGPERQADFADVLGFGSSMVFAVGGEFVASGQPQRSIVAQFDGNTWKQIVLPGNELWATGGSGPGDMWAAGILNSLFHFDGTSWTRVNVDERLSFSDFASVDGMTIASAYRIDDPPLDTTWYYSIAWNGLVWDTLSTATEIAGKPFDPTFGVYALCIIDGEVFSGSGHPNTSIFRFENGRWLKFSDLAGAVFGTSRDNMFNINGDGGVRHYNGTDWYSFAQFENLPFRLLDGWTDGREVFIVGNDDIRSVVLHGK